MNNKTQQIIDYLEDGKTYKQIQDDIRVSPCRISAAKKVLERQKLLKRSLSRSEDDEKSSESSKTGRKSSDNALYNHQFYHSAGLNGSEIEKLVAFRSAKLDFEREKWRSEQEMERKRLENDDLFNKNQEADIKLRADELKFKENEAERPLKILFSRLKQLVDSDYRGNLSVDEVRYYLDTAKRLRTDYQAQAFADNFSFDTSPHAKSIDKLIGLLERTKNEIEKDPKRFSLSLFTIDMMLIRNLLCGVDHHVGESYSIH
jgi:hypothetical protein